MYSNADFYLNEHVLFQEFCQSWFFSTWTRGLFRLCGATRKGTMSFVQQRGSFLFLYGWCILKLPSSRYTIFQKIIWSRYELLDINWPDLEEDRKISLNMNCERCTLYNNESHQVQSRLVTNLFCQSSWSWSRRKRFFLPRGCKRQS